MRHLALVAAVVLWASHAVAQPVKVQVRGGEKAFREQVIQLLTEGAGASGSGGTDVKIELQKKGGAKVTCTGAKTFLPGPSAAEIVAQFRGWLPGALEARSVARKARAELWAQSLQAAADGFNRGFSGTGATSATNSYAAPSVARKLLLFGGDGHRTFLGCLTCGKYDVDSVMNLYGLHGSRYGVDSILNRYSEFGSKYGLNSACNPYSLDPPVIVDEAGGFYGRLTVNTTHLERTTDTQLRAWIAGVCAGQ